MVLPQNGFLFKFAYGWTPDNQSKKILGIREPITKSRCETFWMCLISLVVWPLVIIPTRLLGWVVRILGAPVAVICFGYRPAGWKWRWPHAHYNEKSYLPFEPIKRWPKLHTEQSGELHIMPIVPLFIVAVFLFGVFLVWYTLWVVVVQLFLVGIVFGTETGRMIGIPLLSLGVLLGGLWGGMALMKHRNTGTYQFIKESFTAIKEKYCPVDTFE